MGFRRLATAAIAMAVITTAVPAVAQSSADISRFRAAQARFDREYQLYRQEADLFLSRQGADYPAGYRPDGYRPAPGDGPGGYRVAPAIPANGYNANNEPYYDPVGDYRDGPQYRERILQGHDRVYAGTDGRYYCRRPDGTTGLIIGGAAGGVLGNLVGGRSSTIATLLGAAGGALAGRSIEQNQVRCR
ncbi:glycine zipper 2TM domain-containing protein [Sphingomonadaceae bacterium jetA1]|jgi:hypothetical protein|uniref:glycine zipper 2TM domain-containing protein n=1 Tax=Facivitalis istanbulensis TaxID=3075838 RepID=UPI00348A84C5